MPPRHRHGHGPPPGGLFGPGFGGPGWRRPPPPPREESWLYERNPRYDPYYDPNKAPYYQNQQPSNNNNQASSNVNNNNTANNSAQPNAYNSDGTYNNNAQQDNSNIQNQQTSYNTFNNQNAQNSNQAYQSQQYDAYGYPVQNYPPDYYRDYPPPRRGGFFGPLFGGPGPRRFDDDPYRQMPVEGSQMDRMRYGRSFEEVEDRLNFIKKVFGILTFQLLITIACVVTTIVVDNVWVWVTHNPWLLYVCISFGILLLCSLLCVRSWSRTVPLNYLLLLSFTFCVSYIAMYVAATCSKMATLIAFLFTMAISGGLMTYAFFAKTDLTYGRASVAIFSPVIMMFVILCLVFRSYIIVCIICAIVVIVLGYYLVFHIQTVVGGGRYELNHDDYIIGSMLLYIDIILIFVILAKVISKR